MKKLSFALACAASVALFADGPINSIGFEEYTLTGTPPGFTGLSLKTDAGADNGATSSYWLYDGSGDGSTVKAYVTEGEGVKADYAGTWGAPTSGGSGIGSNYLELSTEGGTLWRSINMLEGNETLGEEVDVEGELYVDTMVQFTPTEDGGTPEVTANADKLAIWLNVDSQNNATNLCVLAGYVDGQGDVTPTTFTIQNAPNIQPGTWYRLTVQAVPDLTPEDGIPGFIIYLDGTKLYADRKTCADDFSENDDLNGELEDCAVFASLLGVGDPTLQAVGFKGSGAIDDLVFTDVNPFPAPASVDFTLTWADGLTPVSYTINGGAPILIDATGTSFLIEGVPAGAPITFTYYNCDGVNKTVNGTIAADGTLEADEAYTWDEYLGAPVNGAYEIADGSKFELFQKGVNNAKIPTAGETFKLTANVALSDATDGIGARDMKDTLGSSLENYTAANVFKGTFDGGDHTISGVILNTGDYIGFFNSCYGATIKNLKLSLGNATGWSDAANDQVGAVFVGVSVNTTIENCQTLVAGDNGSFNTFKATKTAAGFVGFAANGTVFSNCVNNLNVESVANEKAGGFVACAQAGKSTGDGIVIDGCSNLGDVKNGNTNPFLGGFVGYADLKVAFKGANTVAGTITPKSGNYAKSLLHVQGGSVVVAEGASFTVPAGYKAVTDGKAVDGLFFATVDGNVATLVKNSALAAGVTYKVMATGGAPTIELAESQTIAFDQTLATIDATGITAATGCEIEATGLGQPITYTAVKSAPAYPEYIDDEDTDKKGWYDAWKETYEDDSDSSKEEQFLLNIAPASDAAAIAAAKDAFKIVSITPDGNGGWTVKVTGDKGNGDRYGNGRIEIRGCETLTGTYAAPAPANAKFFKAFLK